MEHLRQARAELDATTGGDTVSFHDYRDSFDVSGAPSELERRQHPVDTWDHAAVVDQSVSVSWSRPLHLRSGPQAMAVASGALVVAERHSRLVRLDPRTGTQLWEQRVEDCWGTAVVAGERCLYLSQAGVLHCFDLGDGLRLWSTPGTGLRHYVSVCGTDVLLGGWRGYRPLTRVALADGRPLPFDGAAVAGAGPLAWPQPVRRTPEGDSADAVLIAGSGLPKLLVMAASGAVLEQWPLPEPVVVSDAGGSYGTSNDGRVTFLSGRRTVMTFHPSRGVQVLWRHRRDLRPQKPILHGDTLWLVDGAGIAVIDLRYGAVTDVRHLRHGGVCASALVSGVVLFAFTDGSLVTIDRVGSVVARTRLPARVDRLVPAEDGLTHAIGEGHLVTLDAPTAATFPVRQ
ncbi:PQQ-like domain-containing protein [Micromonospora citrea]|uniref:PQQ-like domain-containing protein n=1 Tax=Micromonospora citrea TaxID=47855 RepID=A0A1C6TSC2_9ACTN|nr:PQQ-binding-like beta-propeller repeat protein [Micromonospora citrea]SCL44702.1 PQQ-like domain-containing protein [Micromonospora citrea]